ncbi:unnamed protein product, partial [Prorocentrum cordatum]
MARRARCFRHKERSRAAKQAAGDALKIADVAHSQLMAADDDIDAGAAGRSEHKQRHLCNQMGISHGNFLHQGLGTLALGQGVRHQRSDKATFLLFKRLLSQKYDTYSVDELQQLIDIANKHNDTANVGFYKSALERRQAKDRPAPPKPLQRQVNDAHQALKITERRLEKALGELDSARTWVTKKHEDVVKLKAELAEKDRIHTDLAGQLHSTVCKKPQQQANSTATQINVRDLLEGRLSEISIVGGDELLGIPSAEYDFSSEDITLLQGKQKELLAGAQELASTLHADLIKIIGTAKQEYRGNLSRLSRKKRKVEDGAAPGGGEGDALAAAGGGGAPGAAAAAAAQAAPQDAAAAANLRERAARLAWKSVLAQDRSRKPRQSALYALRWLEGRLRMFIRVKDLVKLIFVGATGFGELWQAAGHDAPAAVSEALGTYSATARAEAAAIGKEFEAQQAMRLSFARIGWQMPPWHTLVNDFDDEIPLTTTSPALVADLLFEGVTRSHQRAVGDKIGSGRKCFDVVASELRRSAHKPRDRGVIRAIACDGAWTKDRAIERGYLLQYNVCQLCGAAPDSLLRRLWQCPSVSDQRQGACGAAIVQDALRHISDMCSDFPGNGDSDVFAEDVRIETMLREDGGAASPRRTADERRAAREWTSGAPRTELCRRFAEELAARPRDPLAAAEAALGAVAGCGRGKISGILQPRRVRQHASCWLEEHPTAGGPPPRADGSEEGGVAAVTDPKDSKESQVGAQPPVQSDLPKRACRLRIIAVNDVYLLDNLPRLSTLVAQEANGMPRQNVVTTLAGDFLAPSLLSSLDFGSGMVTCLNRVPVDYVCFGNHEQDLP